VITYKQNTQGQWASGLADRINEQNDFALNQYKSQSLKKQFRFDYNNLLKQGKKHQSNNHI
jgi:hypothetical protein